MNDMDFQKILRTHDQNSRKFARKPSDDRLVLKVFLGVFQRLG